MNIVFTRSQHPFLFSSFSLLLCTTRWKSTSAEVKPHYKQAERREIKRGRKKEQPEAIPSKGNRALRDIAGKRSLNVPPIQSKPTSSRVLVSMAPSCTYEGERRERPGKWCCRLRTRRLFALLFSILPQVYGVYSPELQRGSVGGLDRV